MKSIKIFNHLRLFNVGEDGSDVFDHLFSAFPSMEEWGRTVLKSGLENHTGSILLESSYVCRDHNNLFSNFYSKKFRDFGKECSRLHFFTNKGINADAFALTPQDFASDYIGYSVIRPVQRRTLGRTVIDPKKIGKSFKDGFYCMATEFRATINGIEFFTKGFPYTSQDGEATVCAHSALWSVCRYLSERYSHYKEVYPYDLIAMTDTQYGRTVPHRGMRYSDYLTILSSFGCHPTLLRTNNFIIPKGGPVKPLEDSIIQNLFTYVESGFPVLASVPGHVVVIVGHTSGEPRKQPDKENWIDASSMLKQFVVNDDNCFPYQLLGFRDDLENYGALYADKDGYPGHSIDSIRTAVCPLPEKVYMQPGDARKKCKDAINKFIDKYSSRAISWNKDTEPLVSRLFLTSGSAFKRKKQKNSRMGNPDSLGLYITNLHLPHFVWVMEVSPLSKYKKFRATGEIVLDATAGPFDSSYLYARIGNRIEINGSEPHEGDDSELDFELYTHNLGERTDT